jgi:hypothetical protein
LGRQRGFNVAQALPIGEWGKCHDLILACTGQRPDRPIAVVSRDYSLECAPGQKIHQLREQRFAGVHGQAIPAGWSGNAAASSNPSSNDQLKTVGNHMLI